MRWTAVGPIPFPLSWPGRRPTSCPSARRLCRSITCWWWRALGSTPAKSAARPSSPSPTARNTSGSTRERSRTLVSSAGSASVSRRTCTSTRRPRVCAGRTATAPCCRRRMRGSSEGSVAYTETVTLSVVWPDHQPKMKIAIYLWFPKQQTNKRKKKKTLQ